MSDIYNPSGSSVALPVTVPNGGTGDTSFVAYSPILGGTTSTGALQSVASVGTAGQVFTSNGPGAAGSFQAASGGAPTVNAQTNTTYTFVLADANNGVTGSNVSAITWTIPTNASVAFPVGTQILLGETGIGQIGIVGAGGVTVISYNNLTHLAGQNAVAAIWQIAANTWLLFGNLA